MPDNAAELRRYKRTINESIDANAYCWAIRREADYRDELMAYLRSMVMIPFGAMETSMGNDIELRQLQEDFLLSNLALGADYARIFDERTEDDVPRIFLSILRDLVFHHDPATDGVVRLVSQTGGLEASEQIEGIVHSYSPWNDKVQQRVFRLLTSEIDAFYDAGFPEAGQLTNRYLPSQSCSSARVEGEEAILWSGMVPSHAAQYLRVADALDVFVPVRPVNPSSTGLLMNNAAAKGMNIRGKSSSWGPQVGFIPFNQRYSKLWRTMRDRAKRTSEIAKYSAQTTISTSGDFPGKPGRKIAVERALSVCPSPQGLCDVLTDPETPDAEDAVVLKCGDRYYDWGNADRDGKPAFDPWETLSPASPDKDRQAQLLANPLTVLANDSSDLEPRPYLTADYDFLAIGFPFENTGCWFGGALEQTDPEACRPAPTPGVTESEFDNLRGFISERQLGLLRRINAVVERETGYQAGWVTHHGPETQYAKSPYFDYPILVFDPMSETRGDGEAYLVRTGPAGFRDVHLKRVFLDAARRGYNLWPNPDSPARQWEARRPFDIRKGYDPRDAADMPPYVEEAPRPMGALRPPPVCAPGTGKDREAPVAESPEEDAPDVATDSGSDFASEIASWAGRLEAANANCDIPELRAIRAEIEAAQAALGGGSETDAVASALRELQARADAHLGRFSAILENYGSALEAYEAGELERAVSHYQAAEEAAAGLSDGPQCRDASHAIGLLGRKIAAVTGLKEVAAGLAGACDIPAMTTLSESIADKSNPAVVEVVQMLATSIESCQPKDLHPCLDPSVPADGWVREYTRGWGGGHSEHVKKGDFVCFGNIYDILDGGLKTRMVCERDGDEYVNCSEKYQWTGGVRSVREDGSVSISYNEGRDTIVFDTVE